MPSAINVINLSKRYRLGLVGRNTLREDLSRGFAKLLRRPDPTLKIGEAAVDGKYVWALRDVTLDVEQGEVIGVIGRNGAGKSTLLKILTRITAPTSGRAIMSGRIASMLEVGTGFHPELTGRENVYLNGAILGMTKAEINSRFTEIVEFSGVEKYIDTPVKRYSSGMNVRLAFAVAAHLEPEILLIDEVLSVGDAGFQRKCVGKMKEVAGAGRTVLFVSHSMSSISGLCSKVLYLKDGRTAFIGAVEEGIDRYLGDFGQVSSAYVDFAEVPERYGNQRLARMLSLATRNHDGAAACRFKMGSSMQLCLSFSVTDRVRDLEIGFAIFSTQGAKLQTFVSRWEGFPGEFAPGIHNITCEIPGVSMLPGIYTITPWLRVGRDSVEDQVPSALEFEVVASDVTGHSPFFDSFHSGVFQRSRWATGMNRTHSLEQQEVHEEAL